jgi:hypothetical protein
MFSNLKMNVRHKHLATLTQDTDALRRRLAQLADAGPVPIEERALDLNAEWSAAASPW